MIVLSAGACVHGIHSEVMYSLMFASIPTFTEFTTCVTPAHYCMIADSSKSIFTSSNGDELWNKEKEVIRDIVAGFDIGPGPEKSKVTLVKFGGQVEREFNLNTFTDKNAALEAINATKKLTGNAGQGTVTPEAIQECLDIFKEQEQTSVPKVIMVFSDGVTHFPSNHKFYNQGLETQKLKEAVNQSTTDGTINYAVMFVQSNPAKQMQAMTEALIIAQDNEERVFVNETLEALAPTLIKELVCGKYNAIEYLERNSLKHGSQQQQYAHT